MGYNGAPPARCGTPSGYIRHWNKKEKICSECRIAQNEYRNLRNSRNRDKVNFKSRENHRKRMQDDSYREKMRDRSSRNESRRNARKNGNGTEVYTTIQILEIYGNICYLCSVSIDLTLPRQVGLPGWQLGLHIDHVIPLSKGGVDMIHNVRPTHGICNLLKHDRILGDRIVYA